MSDLSTVSKRRILSALASVPEEILHDIFLRLPLKSIGRCRVVCTSWNDLIKSTAFIRSHTRRQLTNRNEEGQALLLIQANENPGCRTWRYALHWDNDALTEDTKLTNPFLDYNLRQRRHCFHKVYLRGGKLNPKMDANANVVGTCNGLVCLVGDDPYLEDDTIVIWNPRIRKYVVLPKPDDPWPPGHFHKEWYVFGCDSRTNDYKVFRGVIYCLNGEELIVVQIWSLSRGSWKTHTHDIPDYFGLSFSTRFALVNDVIHWNIEFCGRYFILSFDLSSELFDRVEVPDNFRKQLSTTPSIRKCIVWRYQESLAFSEFTFDEIHGERLQMWVMKEYGVEESWVSLQMDEIINDPLWLCSRNCSVQVDDSGVSGHQSYCIVDSFIESLVLLDHPTAISY